MMTPMLTAARNVDLAPSISIPHLKRTPHGHQLIVDGEPFLILGGELGNSTSLTLTSIASPWPKLRGLNLNTLLAPVYWELCEPTEGAFDFSLVDALIDGARANDLRLVLLWFGAWKNSMSTYVPAWVKHDSARFPCAITRDGEAIEILSPFANETMEADTRAFAELMKHLRDVDGDRHTVLMVQVEIEIGMLPEARDHSPSATAAAKQWNGTLDGTLDADERFMAWGFARFVNELATRGRAEYALPMYVNAALNRPGRAPGEYPSGGPVPHLIDMWRTTAPAIDMRCPDIYFFDLLNWIEPYRRRDNALFVPEAMRSSRASSNAMNVIARGSIGFCPFSIEDTSGIEAQLLSKTYSALRFLSPLILDAQARGDRLIGLAPKVANDGSLDDSPQTVFLGDYRVTVKFAGGSRPAAGEAELESNDPAMRGSNLPPAGGMIIITAPGEYTIVGIGLSISHASISTDTKVGLLSVEELAEREGDWTTSRRLNGDQTNQGRNVFLPDGAVGMLRVRLYRY